MREELTQKAEAAVAKWAGSVNDKRSGAELMADFALDYCKELVAERDRLRGELLDIYQDSQYKGNARMQLQQWLEKECKIKLFWDDLALERLGIEQDDLIDRRPDDQ